MGIPDNARTTRRRAIVAQWLLRERCTLHRRVEEVCSLGRLSTTHHNQRHLRRIMLLSGHDSACMESSRNRCTCFREGYSRDEVSRWMDGYPMSRKMNQGVMVRGSERHHLTRSTGG